MMDMMRILLSAAAALVLSVPVLIVLRLTGSVGKKTEKVIREAAAAGRVVTAVQEKAVRTKGEPLAKSRFDRTRLWLCTYRYEVEGRSYTLHTQSEDAPPKEIELFYPAGRPNRAVYRGKADQSAPNVFFAVLPVLLWAVFYNFVFR